ncbi:MAG: hypothetical protein ACPG21_10620 [Crocinitomicaceae bacterium]
MSIGLAATYVLTVSLLIGLFTGYFLQRRGYSFWRYFVSGFIAACGILVIIFKILLDYL